MATRVTPTPIPAFAPPDKPEEGEGVKVGELLDPDEDVLLEDGRSVAYQLICIKGA